MDGGAVGLSNVAHAAGLTDYTLIPGAQREVGGARPSRAGPATHTVCPGAAAGGGRKQGPRAAACLDIH